MLTLSASSMRNTRTAEDAGMNRKGEAVSSNAEAGQLGRPGWLNLTLSALPTIVTGDRGVDEFRGGLRMSLQQNVLR